MVGGHKKVILLFAGTAWLRSCRFLFHQLVHGDKSHKVVRDANVLPPFAAALVRRFNVDRIHKLPQCIRRKFVQILVFVCPLDKLLQAPNTGVAALSNSTWLWAGWHFSAQYQLAGIKRSDAGRLPDAGAAHTVQNLADVPFDTDRLPPDLGRTIGP